MTFTFVSNYINHHQKPFCDACVKLLGDDFTFVATMPMEEERVAMGWNNELNSLPYVRLLYEDPEAEQLIYDSDVVLFGWSGREDIAQKRLLSGKTTLRVSERIYREGRYRAISPRGLAAKYKEHIRFRKDPVYMLCAGAYAAADFSLIHAYPGKCLKWGYFPPLRTYGEDGPAAKKNMSDGLQIVWAGRFIPLKHPEYAVKLAGALKERENAFHLHFVGSGEMESELKEQIRKDGLEEYVTMYGFLAPDRVRDVMEKCHIHLCTSNQLEGWGAVVNEGMNSGCAEVVSDRMGAVPFLIENGVNGFTYSRDSYEEMEAAVMGIFDDPQRASECGRRAYETIVNEWNAETAAARLMEFVNALQAGKEPVIPQSGPLSKAPDMLLH